MLLKAYEPSSTNLVHSPQAIALHCLGVVLDRIHYASKSFFDDGSFDLTDCIRESVKEIRKDRSKVVLSRSKASIPLKGLDVPFHSSHLRSGVDPFRRRLQRSIKLDNASPTKLIGRYIPNLTGKPFEVTRQYFNEVLRLTGSIPIQQALESVCFEAILQNYINTNYCLLLVGQSGFYYIEVY